MRHTIRPLLAAATVAATSLVAGCTTSSSSNADGSGCPGGVASPTGTRVTYSLVTVGDPGNASDITGFGAVPYTYRIGTYSVTIGQYAEFLNAVARTDTYGLYDSRMGSDLNVAGIARTGTPGSYSYAAMDNGGDSSRRPIAYVTWFNAARFANWMTNGQPAGSQGAGTTEDGAYTLNGAVSGSAVARNACHPATGRTVTFWIPTENEWYKAAHYSPDYAGTGAPGYYLYATQSNASPGNTVGSSPNQMNVMLGINFAVTGSPTLVASQNYLTDVGAYAGSPSYYGTFDQDGNLYQWNDLDGRPFPYRGVRGSFWFATATAAQSNTYAGVTPTHAGNDVTLRLAASTIP